MMRVFLDTNILLDFGLGREHADDAEKILALGLKGVIEKCKELSLFRHRLMKKMQKVVE